MVSSIIMFDLVVRPCTFTRRKTPAAAPIINGSSQHAIGGVCMFEGMYTPPPAARTSGGHEISRAKSARPGLPLKLSCSRSGPV